MRLSVIAQGCLLVLCGACATTGEEVDDTTSAKMVQMPESGAPEVTDQTALGEPGVVDASMGTQNPAVPEMRTSKSRMQSTAAEILRDPEFQRRVAMSYMSDTDLEPSMAPEERETIAAMMELAQAEDLPGAEAVIRDALSPKASAILDFMLGNLRYQQDDYAGAANSYEVACQKHPRFRRAWSNLSQIYYAEGNYPDAIRALTQVVTIGNADAMTYGLLGVSHSKNEDYLAAESAFRMAVMMEPHKLDWRMALAETLFRQERFDAASVLFGHLIEQYPDRPELWNFQGEAFAMLNKPLKAAENFEVVDRLGKSTVVMLNNLGDIYASQNLHGLAVDAYLRALAKSDSAKLDRALRAAKFLSANGAQEEMATLLDGIQEIRGATLNDADKVKVMKLQARLAASRGADEKQLGFLREAIQLDPRDGEALILLGRNIGQDSPEEASAYFEMAGNIEGFEAEASMRHGELLVQLGRFAEGLKKLKNAQRLRPQEFLRKFIEDVERVSKR